MAKIEPDYSSYASSDFFCLVPLQSETRGLWTDGDLTNRVITVLFDETYLTYSYKRQTSGRAIIYVDGDGYQYVLGSGTVSPYSSQMDIIASGRSNPGGLLTYSSQTATESGILSATVNPDRYKGGSWLPLPDAFGDIGVKFADNDDNFYLIKNYAKILYSAFPMIKTPYSNELKLTNDKDSTMTHVFHSSDTMDVPLLVTTITEGSEPTEHLPLAVDPVEYSKRIKRNLQELNSVLRTASDAYYGYIPNNTVSNNIGFGMRAENAGCIFYNILITHDYDAARKFIEDGTIPDDAEVNDSSPSTPDDSNAAGEDGNTSSTFYDGEPTAPSQTALTLSNLHMYWMTSEQLKGFYKSLWDTDLSDFVTGAFTGIYSNLVSNVVSLKFMPTSVANLGGQGESESVILGFKTYDDLVVQTIGNNVAPIVDIGTYDMKRAYNSFADYAPYTDIALFLPFVGIVPLDTNLFMGEGGGKSATLNIKAQYDVLSGLITYYILRGKTPISYISGNMAVEIPISLQSGLDTWNTVSRNFMSKSIDFAINIGEKSPIGMASDIAEGSAQSPSQKVFASTGGNGGFYTHPKCAIMIKRPQYNRPSTYAPTVGFPSFVSKKISNISGFNIIDHPEIPLTDGMTVTERDMIVAQMQQGLHY